MTVHLVKLCVGIDDVEHLARVQAKRQADARRKGIAPELKHITRHTPKRADEILDGGSIYWVIKGFIRARQRIVDIRPGERADGEPACALVLDPALTTTELRSFRPFQGWRYLAPDRAPPDAPRTGPAGEGAPEAMVAELKGLGLL
jgi:hypothetical protein